MDQRTGQKPHENARLGTTKGHKAVPNLGLGVAGDVALVTNNTRPTDVEQGSTQHDLFLATRKSLGRENAVRRDDDAGGGEPPRAAITTRLVVEMDGAIRNCRKLEQLATPVLEDGHGNHDQRREGRKVGTVVRRRRCRQTNRPTEQGNHLHCLAEAHHVAQNATETQAIRSSGAVLTILRLGHPSRTTTLVLLELALEATFGDHFKESRGFSRGNTRHSDVKSEKTCKISRSRMESKNIKQKCKT